MRIRRPSKPIDYSRRTALYRLFDAEGRLLYVGIAFEPRVRWSNHASEKAWWPHVAERRVEWHDTRSDAAAAEIAAIRAEKPLHNVRDSAAEVAARADRAVGAKVGRMIRVPDEVWAAYGELCDEEGTSRADDIRRHVHSRVNAWRRKQAMQRRLKHLDADQADDIL